MMTYYSCPFLNCIKIGVGRYGSIETSGTNNENMLYEQSVLTVDGNEFVVEKEGE
jgi:hypothetical protein